MKARESRCQSDRQSKAFEDWSHGAAVQRTGFQIAELFPAANPNIPIEVADGHCNRDAVLSILHDRLVSKFASRALFKLPYMLAVRADHRFAQRQAVTVGELANEPLILPERCVFLRDVTNAIASLGVRARIVYRTDHDDRALSLVGPGLGVALVAGHFEVPDVKQVAVSDLGVSRTVGLVWSRERNDEDLKEFVAFAASHVWA